MEENNQSHKDEQNQQNMDDNTSNYQVYNQ